MFVNGVPFLVTFSQKIQLLPVEFLTNYTDVQLSSHLTKLVKLYERGGFSTIFMDQEFDKVVEKITSIKVKTGAAWEHVREIECGILFMTEICRDTQAIMQFKQIPKSFVIHLVYFGVIWINLFLAMQGI